MQAKAIAKYVRTSPQKCRLVADQIRNKPIERALEILQYSNKKVALPIRKTLESAIANAEHNNGADIDELYVSKIFIDQGPVLKRFRARAKGRAGKILKEQATLLLKWQNDN